MGFDFGGSRREPPYVGARPVDPDEKVVETKSSFFSAAQVDGAAPAPRAVADESQAGAPRLRRLRPRVPARLSWLWTVARLRVRGDRPLAVPRAETAESALEPRIRRWSPGIAAGLSFVWPGLGQLFLGRRSRAAILAVPALLAALVAAIQLNQPLWFILSLWDPSYVAAVVVVAVGLGAWRVLAIADAFLSASRRSRPGRAGVTFAVVLIVMVVATHGLFVAGTWAWYQASVDVQNNGLIPNATDSPPPLSGNVLPSPSGDLSPSPPDTNFITPTASAETPVPTPGRNPDRVTIVLIGFDSLAGREGSANTDTMMLISIDKKTEKVSIVSVPRDTTSFFLYFGGQAGPTFKLNTLWVTASSRNWRGPDKPLQTVENEIGYLVGVPVDYYAAVSLAGMGAMIDTLGGIDIYNSQYINDPGTGITMGIGQVHLNGATAMLYVRSRENGGSDYKRAARQQALLVALEKKVVSPSGLARLPKLLSMAGKVIETDFPLSTARDYVTYAQNISGIQDCVLGPPYSIHPDTSTTGGKWTTYLDMTLLAGLSIDMFGQDSRYYGSGIPPAPCQS